MTIWLAQYLCPSRHCIVAMAYDADTYTAAAVESLVRAQMAAGGINPWCGLCASRDLHFEHARLAEQDWQHAIRQLRAREAELQHVRAWLTASRDTVN